MDPNHYLYFSDRTHTHIKTAGASYAFLGATVEDLTQHALDAANAIERHKRHIRALHAVVQVMRPEAVTYQSIDTAEETINALR